MRTPLRLLTALLAASSLVLCLTAAGLWARSTATMDQVRTADPLRQTTLVSSNGELCVETVSTLVPEFEPGLIVAHALPTQYGPRVINWQFAGIGSGTQTEPTLQGPVRYNTLMIPLWLIVVLLAIPPVLAWDMRKAAAASRSPGSAAI
jgi:hypothetical protein